MVNRQAVKARPANPPYLLEGADTSEDDREFGGVGLRYKPKPCLTM
jgi:hypothetical protein